MINTKFEVYKIQREIKRSGIEIEFFRPSKNDYEEKDYSVLTAIGSLKGLYHEVISKISLESGETTQYRTVKEPAFLTLWKDVAPLELRTGDVAQINGKEFLVIKVENIQEWNLIADVHMEVQDIGL